VCALTYLNSTTRSALNSSELLIMAKAYNESHTTSSWTRAACKTHQMSNIRRSQRPTWVTMFVCFFFSELVMRNLISCKPVFEFHLHCNNPVAARSDKLSQTKASLHLTTTQDRYCNFGD